MASPTNPTNPTDPTTTSALDLAGFKSQLRKLGIPLSGEQTTAIFAVLLKHHAESGGESGGVAGGDEEWEGGEDGDGGGGGEGDEGGEGGEGAEGKGVPRTWIELEQTVEAMSTINRHLTDV